MCSVLKLFNLHSNLGKYIYHYHFVDKNLDKIKSQMSDSRLHIYIYIFPPCGFKRRTRPALSSRSSQFHWRPREESNNHDTACDVLYRHTHREAPSGPSNSQGERTIELVIKG